MMATSWFMTQDEKDQQAMYKMYRRITQINMNAAIR